MKPLRSLLILLVAVVLGVIAAQWLSQQQRYDLGEVVVRVGGNDYIAPMPQAVLALIVGLLVLWLLWIIVSLPFRAWGRYRRKRGRARLIEGLRAYEFGQWNRAGKALVAAAEDPEVAPVALPPAIRVADARADAEGRARWNQELAARDPVAHALLQAERFLAGGRPVDAINALDVPAAQPLPPRGLVLRTEALALIGRAHEAYGQLGALRQQQALAPEAAAILERRLAALSLEQAGDANALAERWESLAKPLRAEPAVVAAYARRGAALHWDDAALRGVEQALDAGWDEELIVLYGELPVEKYDSRRASAAALVGHAPGQPGLVADLGALVASAAAMGAGRGVPASRHRPGGRRSGVGRTWRRVCRSR